MDVKAVRSFIEAKFNDAQVDSAPSPHIHIANFFPDDVYAKILEYNLFKFAPGEEWIKKEALQKRRQATPFNLRKQVDLRKPFDASDEAKEFWTALERVFFEGDWFGKLVQKKYPYFFDLRFGDLSHDEDFFSQLRSMMFVQRHEEGYHIGPHTDSPNRVFTCIFAFPDEEGYDQFGTEFVRPKNRLLQCSGDLHHDPDDFEFVKLAPYRPNNFVLFFKTGSSFHSVRQIAGKVSNERYGMQIGFYEPRGGLMKDLSERGLLEDRTAKPELELTVLGRQIQVRKVA